MVINNYNYGRFLGAAIESALAQEWDDLEVVVVDDGSTDDSLDVLARYAGRIVTIRQVNGGQGEAFNAGVCAASGDVVCLLDADDMARPRRAAAVAEAFGSHLDAGWCFHPLEYVGADREPPIVEAGFFDERGTVKRGAPPRAFAPATSGLAFRSVLLDEVLPMPPLRITADNYLKIVAMAVSPGVVLAEPLGVLRLHGDNAYSMLGAVDERRLLSELAVASALVERPETRRYGIRRGMGALKAARGGSSMTIAAAERRFVRGCSLRERIALRGHRAIWMLRELRS